ncbi:methyl-accepting chemotaxis protein [Paraburkholderia sp. Ac-20347]|uniref:methyl-accepting chemotaxis protein n=1 Tax=Paraburkholderia sp. Ac-20347 TaxID=2703892 RepID=UPI00197FF770|nr:PAS domain-containing protein [Paraburkholderia sp. Ac-20347]
MRTNLPVTQREYELDDATTLLSQTDIYGNITYANDAFIKASGFSANELLYSSHNIVRHPDMPPQAFADMWQTLKAGLSWTALVKNRRKDGDHYWVRANATPIYRDGNIAGFLSVRTKPAREEVNAAAKLYVDFLAGTARGLRFHQGLVVRKGWLAWTAWRRTMPVRWRIRGGVFAAFLLTASSIVLLGASRPLIGVSAGIAVLLAAWLEAQIGRPLREVLAQAQAIAAGQAVGDARLNRVDEIGMIERAIHQSGLNLRSLVDDVCAQLKALHGASDDIVKRNGDISQRSEEAAASLEETAATMEQITATVRNNADTADQAGKLAKATSSAAGTGSHTVHEVVATMSDITASSHKIREIIDVIDGIAFQTNILALNAAVEAARAGEHGRGFAVVAGEVRTLAQRSATAARQIATLINDSVSKTSAGSELVGKAGHAMGDIVKQVTRVVDLIQEISLATREQADGIGQVNVAMTQLDGVTQKNARMVQDAAAEAEALSARAQRLEDAVAVFAG